jgi:8-oxo-dGTP pyrophosphatase MutT (NUDIX family)
MKPTKYPVSETNKSIPQATTAADAGAALEERMEPYHAALRTSLLESLQSYVGVDNHDTACAARIAEFVRNEPHCCRRENLHGHLTGSAWVVNRSGEMVLLLLHRGLQKWLQPGGHADGEMNIAAVALREVREESGLTRITPYGHGIFDVDIHHIPERAGVPAHEHYDLRYLFVADDQEQLQLDPAEATAARWVPVHLVQNLTQEQSILRMASKWRELQRKDALTTL